MAGISAGALSILARALVVLVLEAGPMALELQNRSVMDPIPSVPITLRGTQKGTLVFPSSRFRHLQQG